MLAFYFSLDPSGYFFWLPTPFDACALYSSVIDDEYHFVLPRHFTLSPPVGNVN